jgi:uncharacterized membrane protein
VTNRAKRIRVPRSESGSYLAKADEFLSAATTAVAAAKYDAAMLNAIHAAISAADAVTVMLAGIRSSDPDHLRAVDLLLEAGQGSKGVAAPAKQLRQLLEKKGEVEYQSRRARASDAHDAVKRATRLLSWAHEVVAAAKG